MFNDENFPHPRAVQVRCSSESHHELVTVSQGTLLRWLPWIPTGASGMNLIPNFKVFFISDILIQFSLDDFSFNSPSTIFSSFSPVIIIYISRMEPCCRKLWQIFVSSKKLSVVWNRVMASSAGHQMHLSAGGRTFACYRLGFVPWESIQSKQTWNGSRTSGEFLIFGNNISSSCWRVEGKRAEVTKKPLFSSWQLISGNTMLFLCFLSEFNRKVKRYSF